MKKVNRLMLLGLVLMLALTACSTPAATDTAATGAVPTTGAAGPGMAATTAPNTAATSAPAAGAAAADCANIDTQQLIASGQEIYTAQCASCHGAQGEGVGSFPPLAGNQDLTADNVTEIVQAYMAVDAHPKTVTPEDLAGVLTFVRGSFGNTAAAVCPAEIQIPAQ